MPRLYREAPLNSIWEGSGNVTALDLLRAVVASTGNTAEPGPVEVLRAELTAASGADPRLDNAVARLSAELAAASADPAGAAPQARRLAELTALTIQGALLVRHAPSGGRGRVLRVPAGRRLGPRFRHASGPC